MVRCGTHARRRRTETQCRLKYCTARSCFMAAARDLKVPRLRRLPVLGFFLREYRRKPPDFSLRIIGMARLIACYNGTLLSLEGSLEIQRRAGNNSQEDTMVQRTASAEWRGGLKDGSGKMKFGSGAFEGGYSF